MAVNVFEAKTTNRLQQHDDQHGLVGSRAHRSSHPLIDRGWIYLEVMGESRNAVPPH